MTRIMPIARRSGLAGLALVATLFMQSLSPVHAQEGEEPSSLADVLREARETQAQLSRENQQRIAEFRRERNQQRQRLEEARQRRADLEQTATDLEEQFNENSQEIAELEQQFQERQGEFGELFGVARQVAGETVSQLQQSVIATQYPGREDRLQEIAGSDRLPSINELNTIWQTLEDQIGHQSEVVRYNAPVVARDGTSSEQEVVRIGPFAVVGPSGYLRYNADEELLSQLPRSPSPEAGAAADRIYGAQSGDGPVRAVLDPSRGAILAAQLQTPTLIERYHQGGPVGYTVTVLAAIGVLIGIYRLIVLFFTQMAVKGQAKKPDEPKKGNPLGRILMVYDEHKREDVETLELRLDEAILRETPKLEQGLNTLKVLAAVAPLLGLLGTVTGMIITFQQITLFGTGDPQVMAGGISQALVTTVLGLLSAIPLLLLHSFAQSSSRNVGQILEEQAAGLVAERAEQSRG